MSVRTRKLIGTLVFVLFTTFYFLTAISVAIARLPGTSTWEQLIFYLLATVIWFFFAAILIRWMQRPASH